MIVRIFKMDVKGEAKKSRPDLDQSGRQWEGDGLTS
jgi:hypothetical protein